MSVILVITVGILFVDAMEMTWLIWKVRKERERNVREEIKAYVKPVVGKETIAGLSYAIGKNHGELLKRIKELEARIEKLESTKTNES